MRRLLLVNPNTSAATTAAMLAVAEPLLPPDWRIEGRQASAGAPMILDDAGLARAAPEVVRIGLEGGVGAAGVIVAAFGDPGLDALRGRLGCPVVGIGEASLREAAAIGRFGVATTTPALVASIEAAVRRLGLADRCTGIRVPAADPLVLAADPRAQDDALFLVALRCVEEDGAAAVVIGGGPLSGSAARLRGRVAAAVIEPVPAAIRAVLAASRSRPA